jgi:Fe-S oxidoreductase
MSVNRETAHNEMIKIADGQESFVLHNCATCYNCEEYCTFGNHPFYLICERREEKGILTASRPITNQWRYMTEPKGPGDVEGRQYEVGEVKEKAISLCAMEELKKLSKGKLFEDLGTSYVFGLEFFCQVVHLHFAKPSIIKERLPRIIENIKRLGIKQLICLHDECYGSFASLAPAYGMDVPFEPVHYYEYLYDRLLELKTDIKPLNIRVAYQRNCSARLSPDKHRFVNEIFALIGVELAERTYQGENALCCGGIMIDTAGPETGFGVQEKNVDDMVRSGAQFCVFNCPACQMILSEKVYMRGIKPIHMIDLCNLAIGEKQSIEED